MTTRRETAILEADPYDGERVARLQRTAVLADSVVTRRATITNADSPYTITDEDHRVRVDTSGGVVTVTLPLAADHPDREYIVKKVTADANAVTIARSGSDTIDGATSATLAGGTRESKTLQSDGTSSWDIASSH